MRIDELTRKLQDLRQRGFVDSQRRGSTGVGYTLERLLGLDENNLPIPDLGGRVEVKATRNSSSAFVTLFTFNRSVWQVPQREAIKRFGYVDEKGRLALKSTVSATSVNAQGLMLSLSNGPEMSASVVHHPSGEILATWSIYHLIGKFLTKFERMLFVKADRRKSANGTEQFHYVGAELVSEPRDREFLEAMRRGAVKIDLRMHLTETGSVRNRGTALRVGERDLPMLFSKRSVLM